MTGIVTPKALEAARDFLTSVLVGAKKARAVPRSEQAIGMAIESIQRAGEALFEATGGFSLQFEGDGVSVNGVEVTFDTPVSTAVIREALEARGVSSLGMKSAPNRRAIERLIAIFEGGAAPASSPHAPRVDAKADPRVEARARIEGKVPISSGSNTPLGRAGVAQGSAAGASSERRPIAVETYASLLIAVREQIERVAWQREHPGSDMEPPRLHAIRLIELVIDLLRDCTVDLLRLAAMPPRAPGAETHGANTCVLSVAMAYALGVPRRDQLDLGLAALFHAIGLSPTSTTIRPEDLHATIARLAGESEGGRSADLRIAIIAEMSLAKRENARKPHLLSRIAGVASAYSRLVSGFAIPSGERLHPIDAVKRLEKRFDPRLVDLFSMIVRAWPVGTELVLDSGERAVVKRVGARWDRPVVESADHLGQSTDLLVEENGTFSATISGTCRFHGLEIAAAVPLAIPDVPTWSGLPKQGLPKGQPAQQVVVGDAGAAGAAAAAAGAAGKPGLAVTPRAPGAGAPRSGSPQSGEHRPLKSRETIAAKDAVSKVRLPWVEQRAKAREAAQRAGELEDSERETVTDEDREE